MERGGITEGEEREVTGTSWGPAPNSLDSEHSALTAKPPLTAQSIVCYTVR